MSAPIGVPGATRVKRSLSSNDSIGGLPPSRLLWAGRGARKAQSFCRSGADPVEHLGRRPVAPLRQQPFLGVDPVAVGPMLMHPAPGIGPIIEDLAAQEMAAQAPHMLVLAGALQMLMAEKDVVD